MCDNNHSLQELTDNIDKLMVQLATLRQQQQQQSDDEEEKVDTLCKSLALIYNNRGFCYYKSVEFNLAADDYTRAVELDPRLAVAYYNRGTIHYRMNNFDKAIVDLKLATDLEPQNQEFRLAYEHCCQQLAAMATNTDITDSGIS
ncbi:tetratricopeptide repeat protein 32-like [Oppia nitens]|uniref:tetratricopeptide repeat protein 32-like n=1 Tax=Oppia nitens TaxID=1686743 RepID=UPI0023DBD0FB|nr:tetratricopeptide repeat protein 32-like [Oppia nitens]